MVFRRVCGNGNEKNKSKNEQANIFRLFNISISIFKYY